MTEHLERHDSWRQGLEQLTGQEPVSVLDNLLLAPMSSDPQKQIDDKIWMVGRLANLLNYENVGSEFKTKINSILTKLADDIEGCLKQTGKLDSYVQPISDAIEPLEEFRLDAQGRMVRKVIITKVGVTAYPELGRNEFKPPSEFLSKAFLDSIPGATITDEHPAEREVNDSNKARVAKGVMLNHVRVIDGKMVEGEEMVWDADLIKQIKEKKKDRVSSGLKALIVPAKGEYEGVRYDSIQLKPVMNHLAHTVAPRCTDVCKTVLDSDNKFTKESPIMKVGQDAMNPAAAAASDTNAAAKVTDSKADVKELFLTVGDSKIPLCADKVKPEEATALQKTINDALEAAKKVPTLDSELKAKQAELDHTKGSSDGKEKHIATLQTELSDVTKRVDSLPGAVNVAITEKISMIRILDSIVPGYGDDPKNIGKSSKQMMADVIAVTDSAFKLDEKAHSDDYVRGLYESAVRQIQTVQRSSVGPASFAVGTAQNGTMRTDSRKEHAEQIAKNKKARLEMYGKGGKRLPMQKQAA